MPRKSKKINIRLVAEEAGVSLASVSRVLNNHPDVSEALRRQVMAVVEKNNFTPDKSVERLLRISVIVGVGDITDYIATILTGMGLAANAEGIELSIQRYTGRLPLLRVCRIWRCNAVAVISGAAWLDEISTLAAAGIPCMLVGTPLAGELIGYFCTDSYHAM
ncbi:MAG: LacI family DNA-binding transcriptional regulator, partial [Victivallis vadensis]